MLLLHCDNEDGTVFIRTDQLDGETDWKLRKSIKFTQKYLSKKNAEIHRLEA